MSKGSEARYRCGAVSACMRAGWQGYGLVCFSVCREVVVELFRCCTRADRDLGMRVIQEICE